MHHLGLLSLITLGLVACSGDDPPTPTEVRSRISTDVGYILREADAASAAGEALPGSDALGMLERVLGQDTELATRVKTAVAAYRVRGELAQLRGEAVEDVFDPDEQTAYLNDSMFSDANQVGDGIYQVPPDVACAESTVNDDGTTTEAIDPECSEQLAEVQLRIRVSTSGDAMVFALQIGEAHDEPLIVTLTKRSIALTIDLDDAWRAAVALAPLFGEDLPNAELSGQLTGKLEILGPAHAKGSLTFDRALSIKLAEAGQDLDGPTAFRFASAKANVVAVTLDGNDLSGELALALGETLIHDEDATEHDLAGMTANAAFGTGRALELTNVGLGNRTTTVSVAGTRARTIDLNPLDGRVFAATITHDAATGLDTMSVSPRLDVRTTVDHALLGEPAMVYDTTQLFVDGQIRGSASGDRIEVLAGTFSLVTNPSSYGFAAGAGQCITGADTSDPTTGAAYMRWTVGACI